MLVSESFLTKRKFYTDFIIVCHQFRSSVKPGCNAMRTFMYLQSNSRQLTKYPWTNLPNLTAYMRIYFQQRQLSRLVLWKKRNVLFPRGKTLFCCIEILLIFWLALNCYNVLLPWIAIMQNHLSLKCITCKKRARARVFSWRAKCFIALSVTKGTAYLRRENLKLGNLFLKTKTILKMSAIWFWETLK